MKRFIIIQLLAVVFAAQIQAQGDGEIKYRRSSLYSMMINHEGREFGDEIKDVFLKIPVPDKYNNHDLSVKVIYTSEKKLDKNHEEIDEFIRNNGIASRMVGRWFNRDYMTGICDVELVKERGLYNASELDKALASKTQRGNALLEDAGEDLIGNTFLIVNDIRYIDRSKGSSVTGYIEYKNKTQEKCNYCTIYQCISGFYKKNVELHLLLILAIDSVIYSFYVTILLCKKAPVFD